MDKQLTPEQLLAPRYKVIADYPCSMLKVGQIVKTYESAMAYMVQIDEVSEKDSLADYPHLFKKLEWWEERDIEEMPVFIRYLSDNKIYRVAKHSGGIVFWFEDGQYGRLDESLPATEEEYNAYLNSLTSNKEDNG